MQHASLIKYRVAALSEPSMTTSQTYSWEPMISLAFCAVSLVSKHTTCVCLLNYDIVFFADWHLFMPTRSSEWITCLWRFDSSTVSASTSPRVPIPAPERYNAAGLPSPPAPIRRTFAALSFFYPSRPMSAIISYLEYLGYSSFERSSCDFSILNYVDYK